MVLAALLVTGVVAMFLHERDVHRDATGPTVTPTTISPQQAALPPLPSLPDSYDPPAVTGRTDAAGGAHAPTASAPTPPSTAWPSPATRER